LVIVLQDKIIAAFNAYDADRSGFLDFDEVVNLVVVAKKSCSRTVARMITEAAFKHLNIGLDGQLNLDQFLKLVQDKHLPLDSLLPDMKSLYQQFGNAGNRGNNPAGGGAAGGASGAGGGGNYQNRGNSNYQGQNFDRNFNRRSSNPNYNPNHNNNNSSNGSNHNNRNYNNNSYNNGANQSRNNSPQQQQRPPFRAGGNSNVNRNPFSNN
jgi:hypothetical protein